MCGIAGLIHKGKTVNIGKELQDMLQALKHRGPDSTGYALYGMGSQGDYILRFKVGENVKEGSSAANEEVVYSRVPCIDIISDLRPYERNQYLLDNKVYIRIENNDWKDISFEKFKNIYENLKPKNHGYYMSLKKKYIFKQQNTSEKIFNYLKDNNLY